MDPLPFWFVPFRAVLVQNPEHDRRVSARKMVRHALEDLLPRRVRGVGRREHGHSRHYWMISSARINTDGGMPRR